MKKMLLKGAITTSIAALMMSASIAQAVPYTVDTLLDSATLDNSGDVAELNWIRTVTGDDSLTMDFKINSGDAGFNVTANGTDSWFIDVEPDTPGYFMLKFGVPGSSTLADHYVFENIGELTKLVWTNEQVNSLTGGSCGLDGSSENCNIGRLSHYVGTNGDGGDSSTEVPEPTSLLLLGAGLLGLGLSRRRKQV